MIENLNPVSFSRFGRIMPEGFHHSGSLFPGGIFSMRTHEITASALQELVYTDSSFVVLDIEDGIAILHILDPRSESQVESFLLDKTVVINRGIAYGITPLYGKCAINMAYNRDSVFQSYVLMNRVTALGLHPKLEINKVHTLFYQEKEPGFIFKGEKHDFWELTYVDNGILYNITDGTGYKLYPGDMIIYGKNQHHTQWSDAESTVSFITVSFDMDFDAGQYLTNKKFAIDADLKGLLEKIMYEKEHALLYSDDIIICYLKELLIRILRNEKLEHVIQQQESQVKNKIENSIILKTVDFIQANIGSKITISDIARNIPISQSYLSTMFRKHMNMTLIEYIGNYRLEKSKELIKSSKYNFTEIAEMLGYTSVHYFSNHFKQKFGINPTEYSKTIKRD